MNTNLRKTIGQITLALFTAFALTALAPRASAQGGVPLWTNRCAGSEYYFALALDSNGNAIVSGSLTGTLHGNDYMTIKYSGAGVPLWTNAYDGAANGYFGSDTAYSVAVDSGGNVIVTGQAFAGPPLDYDWATIKYSGAGVPLWTNRFNASSGADSAYGVAVDKNGNVFVTGRVGSAPSTAGATVAYSSVGAPLWTNFHTANSVIAVDGSGNVFAAGIKYSNAGVPLWTNNAGVVTDGSGNVFLTAISFAGASVNYTTTKYSSIGVVLQTNNYSADFIGKVVVDDSSDVYLVGSAAGSGGYDFETFKYSSTGVPLWTNRYNGSGDTDDRPVDLAVDSDGNVIVAGRSIDTNGIPSFVTVAYSRAGLPLWTNFYILSKSNETVLSGLAMDRSGNVFVTGYVYSHSDSSAYVSDYVTIKYSSSVVPIHLAIERDGSGGLFIRFTGAPGVSYRLQRAASFTGTWSGLATNTAPASGHIEYHEPSPPPGQAFYRTVQP